MRFDEGLRNLGEFPWLQWICCDQQLWRAKITLHDDTARQDFSFRRQDHIRTVLLGNDLGWGDDRRYDVAATKSTADGCQIRPDRAQLLALSAWLRPKDILRSE